MPLKRLPILLPGNTRLKPGADEKPNKPRCSPRLPPPHTRRLPKPAGFPTLHPGMNPRRFRIAFSFAGEKRDLVAHVAALLARRFSEDDILYDRYHRAEFAPDDLVAHLTQLYRDDSDLIVAVLCPDYDKKEWCGLEWKTIRWLLQQGRGPQIMLTRFARVEPDALEGLAGYVDLDTETPETFATLILERLALNEGHPKDHYLPIHPSKSVPPHSPIPHNLPRLQSFFGRTAELMLIREALHPESSTWGALIDGPGGMGKTSLAIRAAYDCPAGQFDRIIFISLKPRELDDDGLRYLDQSLIPAFLELLNELARELGQPEILKSSAADRPRLLLEALRPHKILLLLDNLESLTTGDRTQLLTFSKSLPTACRAILTSRRRPGPSADTLILEQLDQDAALATLADLAERNPLLAKTSAAERIILYTQTGGKPLLLRWVAGQIGRGSCRTYPDALTFLRSCPPDHDPLEFVFGDLAVEFTDAEKQVLVNLTYFTQPATVAHIATLASAERRPIRGMNGLLLSVQAILHPPDPAESSALAAPAAPPPEPPFDEAAVQQALDSLADRSLVVPDHEEKTYTLVPIVAGFLRRQFPELLATTNPRVEAHAYFLLLENGYQAFDRFPILDAAWPLIAAALPLFGSGPNERLQIVVAALFRFLNRTGRWDELLALYLQAESRALAAGNRDKAGWLASGAGGVYELRQQGAEVVACAGRILAHWSTLPIEPKQQAVAYRLRCNGHQMQQDYPAALADARAAVELARSWKAESKEVVVGLNTIARIESALQDFPAAERDYRAAISMARALGDHESIAICLSNLAELALDRKDWLGAEALARESLPLADQLGHDALFARSTCRLAQALVRQGRRAEALIEAQEAEVLFIKLGAPDLEVAQAIIKECQA